MSETGRGRARGRARQQQQQQQQQQQSRTGSGPRAPRGPAPVPIPAAPGAVPRWGPPRGQASAPSSQQSASGPVPASTGTVPRWGPGMNAPQQPAATIPQQAYQQRAPAPAAQPQGGRASVRQGPIEAVAAGVAQLNINAPAQQQAVAAFGGRGARRGRRELAMAGESLVTRPDATMCKQGKAGRPIRLIANYFEMIDKPNWVIFEYRVDFTPDLDVTSTKKKLFGRAIRATECGCIFDGTILWTPRRLMPDPWEATVALDDNPDMRYRVTARLVKELSGSDASILQVFNLIVRICLTSMNLQLVGRNYFDALASISVASYKVEIWPGYVTSIRQHESKILMCVEIAHKVMRFENALNILSQVYSQYPNDFKRVYKERMLGCVVLTDYNNRTYRIDDVDWDSSPESTFPKHDGSTISYRNYYRQKYNLNIRDTKQPMLVSKAKSREIRAGMAEIIYLVPELCRITGLTDQDRNNFQMMRELANHTRLNPEGRIQRLQQFSQRMTGNNRIVGELKKWDMKFSARPVELHGRVLQQEKIYQANDINYPSGDEADWTKFLRSNRMLSLGRLDRWVLLTTNDMYRDASSFVQNIIRAAAGMGWQMPSPQVVQINNDRAGSYLDGLTEAVAKKPDLIVCCVPNNRLDRYTAIKKKCTVDEGIPSQVLLKKNFTSKGAMSIATKVAIQLNCKLGGAPWTLSMPLSGLMVAGFDVCHDTINKSLSVGAMVSSLDKQFSRYFSNSSAHKAGEELSNDFGLSLIKAVRSYMDINAALPDRILIYRDGVGDGQLPYVFEHELKNIETQLKAFYGDRPLKLGFIVVTKRINTRFFNGKLNPPPGTIVDDVVTMPQRYDFFLVSQCVRQGTVSPTNYNILYNTLGLSACQIQQLTYKMTHMYYNWSGTVRVPAPCQYAHKLAFLVGQALHRDPNMRLNHLLHFL